MNDLLELLRHYGYQLIFALVFLEALGLPLPAAILLLAGGALSALGQLKIYWVIALAVGALLLGDTITYFLGRYTGWGILGLLCRVSINPETCVITSAERFYRRGKITLIFAKFLPGVNTVAAPLAGSLRMRPGQFLGLDLVGVSLYTLFYSLIGFLFSRELARIGQGLQAAQRVVTGIIAAGVVFYLVYRLRLYLKDRLYRVVPRVDVKQLREIIEREGQGLLIYDVRSHGYYEENAQRIPGSLRLEPAAIAQAVQTLPRDKIIYLYCT